MKTIVHRLFQKELSSALRYQDLLVAPRQAVVARSTATAALKEHFATADQVLKTRMDKLVPVLAVEHPDFARDYGNAREIVDSGGGGKP